MPREPEQPVDPAMEEFVNALAALLVAEYEKELLDAAARAATAANDGVDEGSR